MGLSSLAPTAFSSPSSASAWRFGGAPAVAASTVSSSSSSFASPWGSGLTTPSPFAQAWRPGPSPLTAAVGPSQSPWSSARPSYSFGSAGGPGSTVGWGFGSADECGVPKPPCINIDTLSDIDTDLVEIDAKNPLYQQIQDSFRRSLNRSMTGARFRVYLLGNDERQQAFDRLKAKRPDDEEVLAFHGSKCFPTAVFVEGFNPRAGKRAMHGPGTYFGLDPGVSDAYACVDPDGMRYMFASRLLMPRAHARKSGRAPQSGQPTSGSNEIYEVFLPPQNYVVCRDISLCVPLALIAYKTADYIGSASYKDLGGIRDLASEMKTALERKRRARSLTPAPPLPRPPSPEWKATSIHDFPLSPPASPLFSPRSSAAAFVAHATPASSSSLSSLLRTSPEDIDL